MPDRGRNVFQLDVEVSGDGLATGKDGNVPQHTLALIPAAGCPFVNENAAVLEGNFHALGVSDEVR